MKNQHHTIKFANWSNLTLTNALAISIATSIFVILVVFFLSLKRSKKFSNKPSTASFTIRNTYDKNGLRDTQATHNWYLNDLFTKPTYCNACECVMVSGLCCVYCNIYVDEKCLRIADKDKLFKCKKLFMIKDESTSIEDFNYSNKWHHHWIKGNLKLNSICYICNEDIQCAPNLHDYKCAWCHNSAHENCLNNVSSPNLIDECNLSRLVLKPNLIYLNLSSLKRYSVQISLNDIKINDLYLKQLNHDNEWTPLFVFCNLKSGNNDADHIIRILATILNPLQIIEMNKKSVDIALKWMESYSNSIKFKILVCGGDGSVGWILSSLSKLEFKKHQPAVGILPLGTGNDLSRRLGWGEGYVGDVDIEEILNQIDRANYVQLDRWAIKIEKLKKSSLLAKKNNQAFDKESPIVSNPKPSKFDLKFMNNYISVGCDALVTLNFHKERENQKFANRLLNKLIYFKYGTIDTFLKECRFLTENVQLELDGKLIELPHLESIVVLNIPYWGGGVDPWNIGRTKDDTNLPQPNINDGLLEVFGIYSSFHIAQLQVGIAEPFRIGQAKNVRIKLLKRFPVQIDGEPWEQNPALIDISFHNCLTMLEKNHAEEF